jgi:hypothetical protein
MRWYKEKQPELLLGEKRIIKKFLWFPTTCDDITKWLEKH